MKSFKNSFEQIFIMLTQRHNYYTFLISHHINTLTFCKSVFLAKDLIIINNKFEIWCGRFNNCNGLKLVINNGHTFICVALN